jgi:hypothetical protein
MRVAILGAGPAGLMAAYAAQEAEVEVDIFSKREVSHIGGAQYLHQAIPGLTDDEPDGMINYVKVGTKEGYAKKVYGSEDAPTSWDTFLEGEHPAWSLNKVYAQLVNMFWERVIGVELKYRSEISRLCEDYDLVICTVPAKALCYDNTHQFKVQPIKLAPLSALTANTILYQGKDNVTWYRTSNLFGERWTEWSMEQAPRISNAMVDGVKPLTTTCRCHTDHKNFVRAGRFGQWTKAVLTSDAYVLACDVIERERL